VSDDFLRHLDDPEGTPSAPGLEPVLARGHRLLVRRYAIAAGSAVAVSVIAVAAVAAVPGSGARPGHDQVVTPATQASDRPTPSETAGRGDSVVAPLRHAAPGARANVSAATSPSESTVAVPPACATGTPEPTATVSPTPSDSSTVVIASPCPVVSDSPSATPSDSAMPSDSAVPTASDTAAPSNSPKPDAAQTMPQQS
jgi:hypothetical protein